MNEEEILLDVAVLGEQIDQFFKSDIGKFLQDRIDSEIRHAIQELKKVDCRDSEKVWAAQAAVWKAETLRSWLEEALAAGLKARMILEDREE